MLSIGMSQTPPCNPWGINFGGGLNSTALILACMEKGYRPDWILFADTGSEYPGTLEHVAAMGELVRHKPDWPDVVTVRWERVRGEIKGFEPLYVNCLRTGHLPSRAYGFAGCTMKWKVQPMDKWRKAHGFQQGAFAVGYDAGEHRRITSACKRGDDPNFTAWYPLVAWGIDRDGCQEIVDRWGVTVGKSSCFMCPNMRRQEWLDLADEHEDLFNIALEIEENAAKNGNFGRGGGGLYKGTLAALLLHDRTPDGSQLDFFDDNGVDDRGVDDRCHHGGCFT